MPVPFSAVIFDFGGVLTSNVVDSFTSWVQTHEVNGPAAASTIGEWLTATDVPNPLHGLETGAAPIEDFEAALAARLRHLDGRAVDPAGLLDGLFAALRPDEQMWEVVDALRAAGVTVTLLSNSWGDRYPHDRLAASFDDVVISEQVGLRKPDPAIYRLAAQRIDVVPEECVFVDDLELNVRAAEATGMTGLVHHSAAATRSALVDLGLLE